MVHFSCLHGWEHRDAMLTELVGLATNSVLEWDVELNGETYHLTRNGLGFTDRLLQTNDVLVLQHNFSADWMIIDFSGGWQFIGREDLLRLVRGESFSVDGGRDRYGLRLSPAPPESAVDSWTLSDFLRHLDIESRYPGLVDGGASLEVRKYYPNNGHLEYCVHHPLSIHPAALGYFRDRYARGGEAAFEAAFMASELPGQQRRRSRMAIYLELKKLSDDETRTTYGFAGADGARRTLVFDRTEERIWPEDDVKDGIFRAAAQTVAKAWRKHGNELPDTIRHQS